MMPADEKLPIGSNNQPYVPPTALAMLEWRVRHDPDVAFLITPDGAERTYADLARRSRTLARALAAAGVHRGDVVGLYLDNEPSWVVALFACWRLGATAACCGSLTPVGEAVRRFELARAGHVIAGAANEAFARWKVTVVSGEGAPPASAGSEELQDSSTDISPDPDGVAAVLFTSGTTGEPKAISRLHSQVAHGPRMTAGAYAKTAEFRPRTAPAGKPPSIGFNPFGHSAPIGRMVFAMYVGRALVMMPKFDVESVAKIAARYPLDTLQLTPAMIHSLAHTELDVRFKALKYVTSGTAPLPLVTRDLFEKRYGAPVLQAYGSTESAITALERYDDVMAGRRGRGSVGRIAKEMPYRIVDAEGNDVKPGEPGELLGRLKEAPRAGDAGAAKPHPAVDSEGWFHTGDQARIDEHGILYITGRIKDMMIVGGFNVYPGEVEDVLHRSAHILEVVIVAMPDERLGEIPVAGIVWRERLDAAAQALAWESVAVEARRFLEAYKVPRRWFTLPELPRNLMGKVDRARAAALAAEALGKGAD